MSFIIQFSLYCVNPYLVVKISAVCFIITVMQVLKNNLHVKCIFIAMCFSLDVSLYIKFCTECQIPYRYQEYQDGVHNFNDNWLLSLGVCDMIRKHIQVQ